MDTEKHQQFAQRLVRSQDMVFRYIVSLIPRRADAEEVFQQTCLTLWENWERYDPALDFFPWACGFAHNHVRNFRRKMENRQVLLEDAVVEQLHQRSLDRQQQRNERQDALRECLEKLAGGQRAMIESYYGGYQTIQQIATSHRSYRPILTGFVALFARQTCRQGQWLLEVKRPAGAFPDPPTSLPPDGTGSGGSGESQVTGKDQPLREEFG